MNWLNVVVVVVFLIMCLDPEIVFFFENGENPAYQVFIDLPRDNSSISTSKQFLCHFMICS